MRADPPAHSHIQTSQKRPASPPPCLAPCVLVRVSERWGLLGRVRSIQAREAREAGSHQRLKSSLHHISACSCPPHPLPLPVIPFLPLFSPSLHQILANTQKCSLLITSMRTSSTTFFCFVATAALMSLACLLPKTAAFVMPTAAWASVRKKAAEEREG